MNKNKKSLNIHKNKNINNNSIYYKNNNSIIMKTTNSINNIKRKNNLFNSINPKRQKTNNHLIEPQNYKDIFNYEDKFQWIEEIKEELENMKNLNVFKTVKKLPEGANVIKSRWVFKYKKDSEGNIIKRKARLVAKGFTQKYGIDFKDTFSPILKPDSIRILTSIAAQNNFSIQQIDVNAAYLNANLKKDIYMSAPEGHTDYGKYFWKLNEALCGLKQSAKEWNDELNSQLKNIGFKRISSKPCLYVKLSKNKKIKYLIGVYVDDIIITGTNFEIKRTIHAIKNKFKIKEIGEVDFIIGIKFIKHKDSYFINQKWYTKEILQKFNMENCTPLKNMKPVDIEEYKKIKFYQTTYRSAIGNLIIYLAINTRPDIFLK